MTYRKDLDGLRAIAVLAVVASHFQLGDWASGGFVGVDVFFVISGYLIAGIILAELSDGSFSLAEFYRRRISRIFPVLFIVFTACIVASWIFDYRVEAQTTALGLLTSIFFVSNILFYMTSDYFSAIAGSNPLLHTWSLSLEEQFYLFFPLFMLGTKGWRPGYRSFAILLLAAASFAWACRTVEADKAAAFYLLPSRAWELLLGALLASRILPAPRHLWQAEALGAVGLALVVGSILLIDTSMPFPGALAAAPCLGAAAIIHGSGFRTWGARLLSLPPIRYVGLISYSLYLWHWPVLTYYRRVGDPHGFEKIALPLVCIALAALSYHLVERPFRARGRTASAGNVAAAGAMAMACFAVVGVGLVQLAQVFHPTSEAVESVLSYVGYELSDHVREGSCFLTERTGGFSRFQPKECLGWARDRRNVVLIGDSYAAHLWPGLKQVTGEANLLQVSASLCKPVLPAHGERRCRDLLGYFTQVFLPAHHPDMIILAARWRAEDLDALQHTIAVLHGFTDRIVVIGPIVEYQTVLPRLLARQIQTNDEMLAASRQSPTPRTADRVLSAGLAGSPATYVSLVDLLCTPNCRVWAAPGQPLQFDFGHLTEAGSVKIAALLAPAVFATDPMAGRRRPETAPRSVSDIGH